ncbi:ATP7B, partial [Symbiodinium microadriaticum]
VEAYPDHVMTAAMLVAFMLLGKTMEVRAKAHTAFAIKHLLDCQAPSAVLIEGEWDDEAVAVTGKEREVAVELLHRGDIVKVIRGGVIPTDGMVVRGTGSVNESLITGESLPVTKSEGVDVIGGSALLEGTLFIEVMNTIENSILQQIVKLVEGAQMRKANIQQLADRFAGHFTSLILWISFVVLVVWLALLYSDSVPHSLLPENRSKLDIAITITLSTLV